ncbi:MAG: DUF3006 domain-containing protein [Patescibacteria group bacterium]|nr:DUF3006 domain-containing protein [Patescibacteria group bacterium]MBU1871090.1 DUF3006 domain-containing protein [Patescibacteria group bacterium]
MIIKITIDRIENDKAVLKTTDGYSIIWPKNKLPDKTHEGMILVFEVEEEKIMEIKNKKLAKDILNEILNTNS